VRDQTSSTIAIHSLDPGNPAFFPAQANQSDYFYLDVLDSKGNVVRTLTNSNPVRLSAVIDSIPPYGTSFRIDQNVLWHDVKDPSKTVLVLEAGGSVGSLDNPGGLLVQLLKSSFDPSDRRFTASWSIVDTTGKPSNINWFADGIHGVTLDGQHQQFGVGLDGKMVVSLSGTYDPSNPLRGVVLQATSVPGAVDAEGYNAYYFAGESDTVVKCGGSREGLCTWTPEPSSLLLFGIGLTALVGCESRRRLKGPVAPVHRASAA
jgi:hypothetical protein